MLLSQNAIEKENYGRPKKIQQSKRNDAFSNEEKIDHMYKRYFISFPIWNGFVHGGYRKCFFCVGSFMFCFVVFYAVVFIIVFQRFHLIQFFRRLFCCFHPLFSVFVFSAVCYYVKIPSSHHIMLQIHNLSWMEKLARRNAKQQYTYPKSKIVV